MTPSFTNIDFELIADFSLLPLAHAMQDRVVILRDDFADGIYHFYFEISPSGDSPNSGPEAILGNFLDLLDGLDVACRRLALNCRTRLADIGFTRGESGWLYEGISAQLLHRMVSWKIELRFSIYGIKP